MVRILITGASSSVGVAITRRLLKQPDVEIWCGRHQTPIDITDNRRQVIDLDLESDLHAALSGRSAALFGGQVCCAVGRAALPDVAVSDVG